MFLSRMMINGRRRGARALLGAPRAMHAATMAAFADGGSSDDGRVLWRLDDLGNARSNLYVVSPSPPDFTHLVEQAGWPTTEMWDTRPYGPFLDQLRIGQRWHFRLTANPVHHTRLRPTDRSSKIAAHVTVKQQEQWLLDRAEELGFGVVPSLTSAGQDADLAVVQRYVHRFKRDEHIVTLAVATFEGHLEVVAEDRLRVALASGVGRGKAYGCGLLTLAPPARPR